MEDSSIGNGAARIDTDEYMTMNCLFKRIAVRGVRVRNPELSAAAMVMVTGVLCCDGDGDATGNTATRSTLLRQQVLSAAVATSSLLELSAAEAASTAAVKTTISTTTMVTAMSSAAKAKRRRRI
nr:hypothetical protein Iba_chr13aCG5510 [Ipomoea batatas]